MEARASRGRATRSPRHREPQVQAAKATKPEVEAADAGSEARPSPPGCARHYKLEGSATPAKRTRASSTGHGHEGTKASPTARTHRQTLACDERRHETGALLALFDQPPSPIRSLRARVPRRAGSRFRRAASPAPALTRRALVAARLGNRADHLPPGGEGQIIVTSATSAMRRSTGHETPVTIPDKLPPGLAATAITGGSRTSTQVECSLSTSEMHVRGESSTPMNRSRRDQSEGGRASGHDRDARRRSQRRRRRRHRRRARSPCRRQRRTPHRSG